MGYDLYITRKDWWASPEGPEISLEEWVAFARTCADVGPDPHNVGVQNWIMLSHPKKVPLWWSSGRVHTKNPDDEAIAILVRLAKGLSARVLGEDDEVYGIDPANPSAATRQ